MGEINGKNVSNNLLWVDIAKGIAIFLVIMGHTYPPGGEVCKFIFLFHMPLFFLVAGYLYNYEKYKNNFINLIKSSVKRLLFPSFITCLILYNYNSANIVGILKMFLYGVGKPITQWGIEPIGFSIWFILCLFLLRILLWGLLKIVKKYNIPVFVNIIFCFLIASLGVYIGKYIKLPWSLDVAMVALYIAYIGFLLKEYNFFNKKWICFFICIVSVILGYLDFKYYGLSMNERYYSTVPFISLNAAIGLCIILIFISKLISKIKYINFFFQYLGVNTIIIMMVHGLSYSHKGYFICTLWRLLVSIIIIEILALIPVIKDIYCAKSIVSVFKKR